MLTHRVETLGAAMHERKLIRYAVELGSAGREFPSYGGVAGTPNLFRRHEEAVSHRNEIIKQGCGKGRIVKVTCVYQWEEKKPRNKSRKPVK